MTNPFIQNATEGAAYTGFYCLREKRLEEQNITLSDETLYECDVLWTGMIAAGLRELLAADDPEDDVAQKDMVSYFLNLYARDGVQHCEIYWENALKIWRIYQLVGIDCEFDFSLVPELQKRLEQ